MTEALRRDADPRPRRVFITGASSGIGAALARHYAMAGARVGLLGRRRDALEALAAELPGEALVMVADVADARAMQEAAARFVDHAGLPDLVIASAGVSAGTLTECEEDGEVFARILDINVLGMLNTFRPFILPMRQAGAGTLVGIASVAGVRGLPGAGAYSASKAAVQRYLESLRVELHGSGVRVVTLSPGYIDTPMTRINPYPMPFLIRADEAARRIARVIARGRRHAVIPWQMGVVAWVLTWMPGWLYDRVFAHAGRKPRGLSLSTASSRDVGSRCFRQTAQQEVHMDHIDERRQRQRVMVDQGGCEDFQLECDGRLVRVRDVSLDGFAMLASTAPDANHRFAFRLTHRKQPGEVKGTAQVVNYARGATADTGVAGCRILDIDDASASALPRWLSTHVVTVAGVPLTEAEALDIVVGPSLV